MCCLGFCVLEASLQDIRFLFGVGMLWLSSVVGCGSVSVAVVDFRGFWLCVFLRVESSF